MAATRTLTVDPSNAGALQAWDGDDGAYWSDNERIFDGSVARYREPFFAAAAIGTGAQVLDVGCGTGQTTRDAARLAHDDGAALGVDLSSRMLEVARRRAAEERITNVEFVQADAQVHPFDEGRYDVAISRTGAMFFGDPVAAFANIGRALRRDGRLVLLVWQALEHNHWIRDFSAALSDGREVPTPTPGAPGPFALADPERVRSVLSAAGFADVDLRGVAEAMYFGDDADDAEQFVRGLGFTGFMLRDFDDGGRARALAALRASIEAHATPDGVLYPSAAWIVTARRA
jgi:SAM-dependent methyltransferase